MTGIKKFQGSYMGSDLASIRANTARDDAIAAAAIDATTKADAAEAAATAVADAKTKTFRQTSVPTSLTIGDEWIDTDNENKRYVAASVGADAITPGEWEEVPTRILSTADSGERIVIRNDGSGGIIESFSGLSGETPGVIDPAALAGPTPAMTIRPGSTVGNPEAPQVVMQSAGDGASVMRLEAGSITLTADDGTPDVFVDGTLNVNTMGTGSVGSGTFRNSVDARVTTLAPTDTWQVTCSSNANPTSTTNVTIAGLSQSVTSPGTSAVYLVTIDADWSIATANTVAIIELLVDGSAQTASMLNFSSGTGRWSLSKTWRITGLSAASHTFTARTRNTAGSSSSIVNATNTQMTIQRRA